MKNVKIRNEVLNEIKASKIDAEKIADKNLEEALKDDEFEKLYRDIKTLGLEIVKKEFFNQSTKDDKARLKSLEDNFDKALNRLNLSRQDIVPNYSCKICEDTGINGDDFCKCYYKRLNEKLLNNLGINLDKNHNFKNVKFDIFDNPKAMESLYKKIKSWCDNFEKTPYKNLLFSGPTGVGKTYLVDCILSELLSKELLINYYSAFALNDLFLKYRTTFDEGKSGILDDVLNCDVLVIDDLGTEPGFKNIEDFFYLVVNERLNKNKSTIITTNLSLLQILDKYGERTFSRLCNKSNSLLVEIKNSDLRMKRK